MRTLDEWLKFLDNDPQSGFFKAAALIVHDIGEIGNERQIEEVYNLIGAVRIHEIKRTGERACKIIAGEKPD
jgi:hypothetical protein